MMSLHNLILTDCQTYFKITRKRSSTFSMTPMIPKVLPPGPVSPSLSIGNLDGTIVFPFT